MIRKKILFVVTLLQFTVLVNADSVEKEVLDYWGASKADLKHELVSIINSWNVERNEFSPPWTPFCLKAPARFNDDQEDISEYVEKEIIKSIVCGEILTKTMEGFYLENEKYTPDKVVYKDQYYAEWKRFLSTYQELFKFGEKLNLHYNDSVFVKKAYSLSAAEDRFLRHQPYSKLLSKTIPLLDKDRNLSKWVKRRLEFNLFYYCLQEYCFDKRSTIYEEFKEAWRPVEFLFIKNCGNLSGDTLAELQNAVVTEKGTIIKRSLPEVESKLRHFGINATIAKDKITQYSLSEKKLWEARGDIELLKWYHLDGSYAIFTKKLPSKMLLPNQGAEDSYLLKLSEDPTISKSAFFKVNGFMCDFVIRKYVKKQYNKFFEKNKHLKGIVTLKDVELYLLGSTMRIGNVTKFTSKCKY